VVDNVDKHSREARDKAEEAKGSNSRCNNNRDRPEVAAENSEVEDVVEVQDATDVGSGDTLHPIVPHFHKIKDEGAFRLQGVEADILVAVARVDEVNPHVYMRW
jgi:hypothetical protein